MWEEPEQEFAKQWAANMSVGLSPLLNTEEQEGVPRSGVFAAACYTHGGFTHSGPLINGMNYYTAFANFYFKQSTPDQYKLADDCGIFCNPTCV